MVREKNTVSRGSQAFLFVQVLLETLNGICAGSNFHRLNRNSANYAYNEYKLFMSSTMIINEKHIFQWISCLIDTPLQEFFVSCGRSELQRTKQPKNHWERTPLETILRTCAFIFHEFLYSYFFTSLKSHLSISNHRLYDECCWSSHWEPTSKKLRRNSSSTTMVKSLSLTF